LDGGGFFSKLKIKAKNSTLVTIYNTFVELLDHFLSQFDTKGPRSKGQQLKIAKIHAI